MEAYVRKLYNGHYYLIKGNPENHKQNTQSLGEFITRRQAIRHCKKLGYDLIIKSKEEIPKPQQDQAYPRIQNQPMLRTTLAVAEKHAQPLRIKEQLAQAQKQVNNQIQIKPTQLTMQGWESR